MHVWLLVIVVLVVRDVVAVEAVDVNVVLAVVATQSR